MDSNLAACPFLQAGEGYDQETIASLGLMVQFILLGAVFCLGHVLRRNKIIIVHEAGAALLLGEETDFHSDLRRVANRHFGSCKSGAGM